VIPERATVLAELLRLAITIADDQSRVVIEASCAPTRDFHNDPWFDTDQVDQADALLQQRLANAIEYLHLRQRIRKHAELPHLVSFLP